MTAPDRPDDLPLEQSLLRSRMLEDAPDAVIERAMGIFEPRARPRVVQPEPAGLLTRLAAVLSFDSALAAPQALGLRSGATTTRQILFSADGRDVDLRIRPATAGAAQRWRISGQVLGPDLSGTARLVGPDRDIEVPWSELAEFGFDDVCEGTWVIGLRTSAWELELPPIHVPAGP